LRGIEFSRATRTLAYIVATGAKLHEVGDLAERMRALESTVAERKDEERDIFPDWAA
jgi:hypothetical protein